MNIPYIHPAIIESERRKREREYEDRRIPLYLPIYEPPAAPPAEAVIDYVVEF